MRWRQKEAGPRRFAAWSLLPRAVQPRMSALTSLSTAIATHARPITQFAAGGFTTGDGAGAAGRTSAGIGGGGDRVGVDPSDPSRVSRAGGVSCGNGRAG